MKSWDQRIYETKGLDRALVYLERAQGRGSKRLIEDDIRHALEAAGAASSLEDLMGLYEGVGRSSEGLRRAAYCLAMDLADPETRRDYHGVVD